MDRGVVAEPQGARKNLHVIELTEDLCNKASAIPDVHRGGDKELRNWARVWQIFVRHQARNGGFPWEVLGKKRKRPVLPVEEHKPLLPIFEDEQCMKD